MRYLFAALGLIAALAVLGGLKAAQISRLIDYGAEMEKAGPPPEAIGAAAAERQTWERTITAVGSVVSAQGVVLGNEVPGVVTKLHFDSGAIVKRGQVLLELDTSVERAQLGSTRARRALAEISANRSRALVTSGAVARAQVDADESSLKSLTADASALEALSSGAFSCGSPICWCGGPSSPSSSTWSSSSPGSRRCARSTCASTRSSRAPRSRCAPSTWARTRSSCAGSSRRRSSARSRPRMASTSSSRRAFRGSPRSTPA